MQYEPIEREPHEVPEPRPTRFPGVVRAAGIIWILFGSLIIINGLLSMALIGVVAANAQRQVVDRPANGMLPALLAGGVCGGLTAAFFGGGFIFVGVQSITGTARDTLGNGIGSIVFGCLCGLVGVVRIGRMAQLPDTIGRVAMGIDAAIAILSALGLLVAGVLALVGREEYKQWRQLRRQRENQG